MAAPAATARFRSPRPRPTPAPPLPRPCPAPTPPPPRTHPAAGRGRCGAGGTGGVPVPAARGGGVGRSGAPVRSCGCSGTGGWRRASFSPVPVIRSRHRHQDGYPPSTAPALHPRHRHRQQSLDSRTRTARPPSAPVLLPRYRVRSSPGTGTDPSLILTPPPPQPQPPPPTPVLPRRWDQSVSPVAPGLLVLLQHQDRPFPGGTGTPHLAQVPALRERGTRGEGTGATTAPPPPTPAALPAVGDGGRAALETNRGLPPHAHARGSVGMRVQVQWGPPVPPPREHRAGGHPWGPSPRRPAWGGDVGSELRPFVGLPEEEEEAAARHVAKVRALKVNRRQPAPRQVLARDELRAASFSFQKIQAPQVFSSLVLSEDPLDESSSSGLAQKWHLSWCKSKNAGALRTEARDCPKEPALLPEPCGPQQSAWMGPCSRMPPNVSISQELTPGLCPAWKTPRGASARYGKPRVGPALLPAGCCRFELGQAFVSGRLSSPLQPQGLMICGRHPGRGRKGLSLQHRGAAGSRGRTVSPRGEWVTCCFESASLCDPPRPDERGVGKGSK